MGLHRVDNCIFTGLPVSYYEQGEMWEAIEYVLDMGTYGILFRLHHSAINWEKENDFFKSNKHIFRGLIFNNNWFEDQDQKIVLITIEKLRELLSQRSYPRTPQEKSDSLFQYYLSLQKEDGQPFRTEIRPPREIWKKLYFRSNNELSFYTEYLQKAGLIHATYSPTLRAEVLDLSISVEGLNYGIQLQSEGERSNLCFIAMAFKAETSNIRDAIKEALIKTEYQPVLMDELNIDSDRTINDEIIANLKK